MASLYEDWLLGVDHRAELEEIRHPTPWRICAMSPRHMVLYKNGLRLRLKRVAGGFVMPVVLQEEACEYGAPF